MQKEALGMIETKGLVGAIEGGGAGRGGGRGGGGGGGGRGKHL